MADLDVYCDALIALDAVDQRRHLRTVEAIERPWVTLDGQRVLDFCSNDYLGLSQDKDLLAVAQEALVRDGMGTGGSRLIGGSNAIHLALEQTVADFHQAEKALVYNSGYHANVGLLSALAGRNDVLFCDRLNHASLVDGARLSGATMRRYPHGDMAALRRLLAATPCKGARWIVTDTLFSMDGDLAPIVELDALAREYNAFLVLDEAHAVGVYGPNRAGGWDDTRPPGPLPNHVLLVGTFSKAFGGFGAYVAGAMPLIETLIQSSRALIYTTSLPPSVVAFNHAALCRVRDDDSHTRTLWHNISLARQVATDNALPIAIHSPIVPVVLGSAENALRAAKHLLAAGFFVQPIRPPSVPEGACRLRLTFSASHGVDAVTSVMACLTEFWK